MNSESPQEDGWSSLTSDLGSRPSAASWGTKGEVQVFGVKGTGELGSTYWDGKAWHPWYSHGSDFRGDPAAAALDANQIDVFGIGSDGVLRHLVYDGSWGKWHPVAGAPVDPKSVACTWSAGRLDLFVRGADDELWYSVLEKGSE
ncbi:MAG TPA: hypothetical protein VND22_04430 [Actinomycetota bacterium]|nr:hypothetical protein [Actinomycetota bacterium]